MRQKPIYIKIDKVGNKFYYRDKKMTVLHRNDGPAIEFTSGSKSWYQHNLCHRTDGPAIECFDGYKAWYVNGQLHRTDGPAVEYVDGSKEWWQNGLLHRTDGPAIEWTNTKYWYINGECLFEEEFLAVTAPKIVHELTLDDIAARLGIAAESLKIVKEH